MNWHQWRSGHSFYAVLRLPSGWSAMVIDDSQDGWPQQRTKYTIAASSRRLHIPWCETFDTLEDAKRESLNKALELPNEPANDAEALALFNEFSPMAKTEYCEEITQ